MSFLDELNGSIYFVGWLNGEWLAAAIAENSVVAVGSVFVRTSGSVKICSSKSFVEGGLCDGQ